MLQAGLPLLEAIQTLIESTGRSSARSGSSMLIHVREQLRAGQSLGQAMGEHSGWFEATDIAIVEAGQAFRHAAGGIGFDGRSTGESR